MNSISILIADDHVIVREGLRSLLALDPRFIVLGEAENGREAVAFAQKLHPDVVIMDIAMPLLNGLEACRQISAAGVAKVLILSAHCGDEYLEYVTEVGAKGYLVKHTSADSLMRGICVIQAGGTFFGPEVAGRLCASYATSAEEMPIKKQASRLTQREREVLQLVAEGAANKQIAALLQISIKTVEKHRQSLMSKLRIHETAGLTRYAISSGLVESGLQVRTF